jgi:hypothetical protein
MKTPLSLIVLTSIALTLAGCGKKDAVTPTVTPARKTSFAEVTSQLDAGGNVYVYLSTDQWLAGLSTNVARLGDLLTTLPDMDESDREKVGRAIEVISHAIKTSGLEDLGGVGVSGVQITPELHRTKLVFHHEKGRGSGVLWNIPGKQPHPLAGLNLLTANTALAAFGDVDVPLLWSTLEGELRGVPELADALRNWPREFEKQTKMSWPKLLASLGGEAGFVLTLDSSRMITIPVGQPLELPEPGLLIALKVNDDLLYDRISSELEKTGRAQITNEQGLKMSAMRFPIPLPLELSITVASSGGYFFLATSPTAVRNALEVRDGKQPGLRKSEKFAALMKYLPAEGNSFCYVDPRFSETIQSVQKEFLRRAPAQANMELVEKLFLDRPAEFGMSIGAHTPTGWQSVSVGNQDSATALLAAPAVGGTAMIAAMVLPALAKAKERAQSISCVNNMKQIGLAFRIWAGDNDDQFPFNVSTGKGGTLELCSRGDDGFDRMSYLHFQVMSNELTTPRILVCPGDSSKHAALGFGNLAPENVSYLVRSGKDVNETNPNEVLIYCPVHHHIGRADGSVQMGSKTSPARF